MFVTIAKECCKLSETCTHPCVIGGVKKLNNNAFIADMTSFHYQKSLFSHFSYFNSVVQSRDRKRILYVIAYECRHKQERMIWIWDEFECLGPLFGIITLIMVLFWTAKYRSNTTKFVKLEKKNVKILPPIFCKIVCIYAVMLMIVRTTKNDNEILISSVLQNFDRKRIFKLFLNISHKIKYMYASPFDGNFVFLNSFLV